jgi:hypothetical protein
MYSFSEKTFYVLSSLALMSALFVITPNANAQVSNFQSEIGMRFQIAAIQVFGDQPILNDVKGIVYGVNDFYQQSADAMLALLTPTSADKDMNQIIAQTYTNLKLSFNTFKLTPQIAGTFTTKESTLEPKVSISDEAFPSNFMQDPPVYNLLPEGITPKISYSADVASTETNLPQVSTASWTNMRDSVTGQVYCVAIFNAEVNRYIGPCKNDYQ